MSLAAPREEPAPSRVRAVSAAIVWATIGLGLTVLLAMEGEPVARALLPWMRAAFVTSLPEFRVKAFDLVQSAGQSVLYASVELDRILSVGKRVIYVGGSVDAQLTLGGVWQTLTVGIASAAAWPQPAAKRIFSACVSAALSVLVTVWLVPARLAGLIVGEYFMRFAADQIPPAIVRLPRFLEGGGQMMVGFVAALLSVMAVQTAARSRTNAHQARSAWDSSPVIAARSNARRLLTRAPQKQQQRRGQNGRSPSR